VGLRLLRDGLARAACKARSWQALLFGTARLRGTVYNSQFSYTSELVCTSVSMHWVMACHSEMHPVCTREQMQGIMEHGLRIHLALRAEWPAELLRERRVQTHELLQRYPLPARFECLELHGCVGHVPDQEMAGFCVALDDLERHLRQAGMVTGMLFTARGHTTALFAGRHGVFHFDSAVATVDGIELRDVAGVLKKAHKIKLDDMYCVTIVRTQDTARSD
jgi:hypothetical protein